MTKPQRFHITRTFRRGLMVPEVPPDQQPPRHHWLLHDGERIVGPWTPWDLHAAWRKGELGEDAQVRREDMDQCIPLRDAWELVDLADMARIQQAEAEEAERTGSGSYRQPVTD
jgi:hypothetical protein